MTGIGHAHGMQIPLCTAGSYIGIPQILSYRGSYPRYGTDTAARYVGFRKVVQGDTY